MEKIDVYIAAKKAYQDTELYMINNVHFGRIVYYVDMGNNKIMFDFYIKEVPRYAYGTYEHTIDPNWAFDELISHITEWMISDWEKHVTDLNIVSFREFIWQGETYGWD